MSGGPRGYQTIRMKQLLQRMSLEQSMIAQEDINGMDLKKEVSPEAPGCTENGCLKWYETI